MAQFSATSAVISALILVCLCRFPASLGDCSCDVDDCCSQGGSCGLSFEHCGYGCQAGPCLFHDRYQIPPSAAKWMTPDVWNQFFPHRDDERCPAAFFFEHEHFQAAAESFSQFGTIGDDDQQKREVAAFFAHAAHATTLRVFPVPDGPLAWGLCIKEESPCGRYCRESNDTHCADGHNYCGRGPLQLRWNYRYAEVGAGLGFDGINNPEQLSQDSTLAFQAALHYWMRPQPPKPIFHDVFTGKWQPSSDDYEAHRQAGFGLTINIISSWECGHPNDASANERIALYRQFCQILGVEPGDNLDCEQQVPYT